MYQLNIFKWSYPKGLFKKIKFFFRKIKWSFQRIKYGFCDFDSSEIIDYLPTLSSSILKSYLKNIAPVSVPITYTPEEWEEKLREIIANIDYYNTEPDIFNPYAVDYFNSYSEVKDPTGTEEFIKPKEILNNTIKNRKELQDLYYDKYLEIHKEQLERLEKGFSEMAKIMSFLWE